MGLFDKINDTVRGVEDATYTANRGINATQNAKKTADTVGGALAKKCKYCNKPLQSDAEKNKGVCANCALERMSA